MESTAAETMSGITLWATLRSVESSLEQQDREGAAKHLRSAVQFRDMLEAEGESIPASASNDIDDAVAWLDGRHGGGDAVSEALAHVRTACAALEAEYEVSTMEAPDDAA